MQYLPAKLPDFKNVSILVIGDCMLDRYWFGNTDRISPEAPVPVLKINTADNRPGGAGNVALNIAALGGNVTLLGVIGQDEAGDALRQQLDEKNVHPDFCIAKSQSTIIKLRIISKKQQLIRLDFEEKLVSHQSALLLEKFKSHLPQTDLVIISDYNKGTLPDPHVFIEAARKQNVKVLVDPKRNNFHIYRGASILTPNMKEFESVVGGCERENEMIAKARALLKEHHIDNILVTRGELGMTYISPDVVEHFPAFAKEIFDVTGAGDTVIGTLGVSLAAGTTYETAAALANLAASLVVGKFGAAHVRGQELQAVLTEKTISDKGIVDDHALISAVTEAKKQGKKIVFTNGCFDVLHIGHVRYLQMAKQLGDYLIVAVNEDASIKQLKGPARPINPLEHRMAVLAGLNAVDWVVSFPDATPHRLLKLIQPDFLVKGDDYSLNEVVGAEVVRAYGGDVRIMQVNIKKSSSDIIRSMQSSHEEVPA